MCLFLSYVDRCITLLLVTCSSVPVWLLTQSALPSLFLVVMVKDHHDVELQKQNHIERILEEELQMLEFFSFVVIRLVNNPMENGIVPSKELSERFTSFR